MKKCGQVDNLPEMEINTLSGRQRRRRKIKKKFQQNNKSNKNKNKKKRSFQGDWMYRRQRAPESLIFRTPLSRLDLFFGFFFLLLQSHTMRQSFTPTSLQPPQLFGVTLWPSLFSLFLSLSRHQTYKHTRKGLATQTARENKPAQSIPTDFMQST